jgi:predicted S18 family serine protease
MLTVYLEYRERLLERQQRVQMEQLHLKLRHEQELELKKMEFQSLDSSRSILAYASSAFPANSAASRMAQVSFGHSYTSANFSKVCK